MASASAIGFCLAAPASTIAALVARSPCAGSRGGSTDTREKSRPAGRAPRVARSSSAPRTRRRKSPKILVMRAAYARQLCRRIDVEKPPMFAQRILVGHAREVVRDGAGGRRLARPGGQAAPLARQAVRVREEQPEQLADHALSFEAHTVDAVVAVHALEQKRLQRRGVAAH